MRAERAQIGVMVGANRRNPFALYATELLESAGFSYALVDLPRADLDLLVVPDIVLSDERLEAVSAFAEAGGSVLALRPAPALRSLFGLRGETPAQTLADRYARLPDGVCVQFHGPADLLESAGAETLAPLLPEIDAAGSAHPAVVRAEAGGRRAAFTFDPARSAVLFHQGRADQAGDGPNPDPDGDGMFKPNDLFVNHLDPRCKHLPQADLWLDLLTGLIDWLTEARAPVPRLWRFPDAAPAVAFFNGDSDASTPEDLALGFDTAARFGSKYTLFLKTDGFDTLSPSDAAGLRASGHEIGLHPWLHGTPTVPEFRDHLVREYDGFRQRYGYVPASVRNHSLIIAGWVDTPAIFQQIGVRMDLNVYPARRFQSGFQSGSALPTRPMTAQGERLDIYQQATLTADDTMLTDKCALPAHTIDGAIRHSVALLDALVERYHGVYQPCFHPVHFRSTRLQTLPWYEAMHDAVRSRGLPGVNGTEWSAFNDARRSVTVERDATGWRVSTRRAVRGLTLLWPTRVAKVVADGASARLTTIDAGAGDARAHVLDLTPDVPVRLEASWSP